MGIANEWAIGEVRLADRAASSARGTVAFCTNATMMWCMLRLGALREEKHANIC